MRWFWDRFCVWVVMCVLCSVSRGDVLLWNASINSTLPRQEIRGGESATTAMDLTQAGYAQIIYTRFGTPLVRTGGVSRKVSIWLGNSPFEKLHLVAANTGLPGADNVNYWLPVGRTWLTVEAEPNSINFIWLPSATGEGKFMNSSGQVVTTAGFAGQVFGVVPEPEFAGLLLICCAAGIFWAWKGRGR